MNKYSEERKLLAVNTAFMMQPIKESDEIDSLEYGDYEAKDGNKNIPPSESSPRQTFDGIIYPFIKSIIVADDLLINLEVLKNQLLENGVIDRCIFCTDGQESIETAKRTFEQQIKP